MQRLKGNNSIILKEIGLKYFIQKRFHDSISMLKRFLLYKATISSNLLDFSDEKQVPIYQLPCLSEKQKKMSLTEFLKSLYEIKNLNTQSSKRPIKEKDTDTDISCNVSKNKDQEDNEEILMISLLIQSQFEIEKPLYVHYEKDSSTLDCLHVLEAYYGDLVNVPPKLQVLQLGMLKYFIEKAVSDQDRELLETKMEKFQSTLKQHADQWKEVLSFFQNNINDGVGIIHKGKLSTNTDMSKVQHHRHHHQQQQQQLPPKVSAMSPNKQQHQEQQQRQEQQRQPSSGKTKNDNNVHRLLSSSWHGYYFLNLNMKQTTGVILLISAILIAYYHRGIFTKLPLFS